MNPVYVDGLGYADSAEAAANFVSKSKLRRCSQYVKMAATAAAMAVKEADMADFVSRERIGTVISTGYGPVEYNTSFADTIFSEGPSLCSPTIFSFTVPNSCAGMICIINDFRGAATMMIGGNPLEYASLLLNRGSADYVLSGCVEENTEEMLSSLREYGSLEKSNIKQAAVMAMLSGRRTDSTLGEICGISSRSLPVSPFVRQCPKEAAEVVAAVITDCVVKSGVMPKIILSSANGSTFDVIEEAGIRRAIGDKAVLEAPKKTYGETLGCGFMVNVYEAIRILPESGVPIMALGADNLGNYLAAMVNK